MYLETILSIVGGLVLFLFAVISLSDLLKSLAAEKSKEWLVRFTGNLFTAIVTGTIITAILDSSSAVIIITIIFVNSGIMNFRQAMGIVMGANIGTTISSQIIAMDVGKYSPMALGFGLFLIFISKSERWSNTGRIFLFFGMLFFGLYTMERAVVPLKQSTAFNQLMNDLNNPLSGTLAGALVTLVIQSSSATVGMAITLAKQNAISLGAAIAVMLGAELGTCSDTLFATIRTNRQAMKTGLFHFLFNLSSIALGLLFFNQFVALVALVSGGADEARQVANAHMLLNLMGVLVFVWFVPYFERALNYLLPDKNTIA